MQELHKKWRNIWREIIGVSSEDIAEETDCDFDLHFDIWSIDEEAQEKCFALFPYGDGMLDRARQALAITRQSKPLDDQELLTHVTNMNSSIQEVLELTGIESALTFDSAKSKCVHRRVYRGDNEMRMKIFAKACSPTESLDYELGDLFKEKLGDEGLATYSFLREPLYRTVNDTVIRNWILWAALLEEYGTDPYAPAIELYKYNAQAGWGKDELFVFQLVDKQ